MTGVQRVDIDGVPVFWRQGPPPLSATLIFKVGRRDETFVHGGITHLVEHLAMRAYGRTHLACNAFVALGTTAFEASGPEEQVLHFLRSVCETLADLPVAALAVERSVLRREGGASAPPLEAAALGARYGAQGLGLAGYTEPAVDGISEEKVRGWAERFFVRGNAALALTGPPPVQMRLPLAEGPANVRDAARPRPLVLPAWTEGPSGAAVSFVGPDSEALMAGMRIALARGTEELRHLRGDAYEVDFSVVGVDVETSHATFTADPGERRASEVANRMLDILTALATEGPAEEELTHDREGTIQALTDPRAVDSEVCAFAAAHLAGAPTMSHEDQIEAHRRLQTSDVAAALAPVLDTALVVVPTGVRFARPRVRPAPISTGGPVEGRVLRRRPVGSWAPRGARLVLGDDGISVVYADGDHSTARWPDVNGVGQESDGMLVVQSADGAALPLREADWLGGGAAVEALRRHVPDELFFTPDADEDEEREER